MSKEGKPWAIGTQEDREYWDKKYEIAQDFTKSRNGIKSALIEVAAQHPLINGEEPNEEFKQRLYRANELYVHYKEMGYLVEIYVPGSRHVFNGIADHISLAKAGTEFLLGLGIPPDILQGEDLNIKYKGDNGVYSSADECFVAASYYKEGGFGRLISVVSPGQVIRKSLFYIEFGVFPFVYSVPVQDMFHNPIGEVFETIPYVLFYDHDMQSPNSEYANYLRRERKPKQ